MNRCPWAFPALVVVFVLGFAASPAGAQGLRASPVRGVVVPNGAVAGEADATSLELNPGQLALVQAGSFAFVYDDWERDTPRPGRGLAELFALPIFGSTVGIGWHWLRPTLPGPGESSSYGKLQLGYAFRVGREAGLGVAW